MGITFADNRVNPNSASYMSGYKSGIVPYIKAINPNVSKSNDMAFCRPIITIVPNGAKTISLSHVTSNNPYDNKTAISSVANGTFSGNIITVTNPSSDITVNMVGFMCGASEGYVQNSGTYSIISWTN